MGLHLNLYLLLVTGQNVYGLCSSFGLKYWLMIDQYLHKTVQGIQKKTKSWSACKSMQRASFCYCAESVINCIASNKCVMI